MNYLYRKAFCLAIYRLYACYFVVLVLNLICGLEAAFLFYMSLGLCYLSPE